MWFLGGGGGCCLGRNIVVGCRGFHFVVFAVFVVVVHVFVLMVVVVVGWTDGRVFFRVVLVQHW